MFKPSKQQHVPPLIDIASVISPSKLTGLYLPVVSASSPPSPQLTSSLVGSTYGFITSSAGILSGWRDASQNMNTINFSANTAIVNHSGTYMVLFNGVNNVGTAIKNYSTMLSNTSFHMIAVGAQIGAGGGQSTGSQLLYTEPAFISDSSQFFDIWPVATRGGIDYWQTENWYNASNAADAEQVAPPRNTLSMYEVWLEDATNIVWSRINDRSYLARTSANIVVDPASTKTGLMLIGESGGTQFLNCKLAFIMFCNSQMTTQEQATVRRIIGKNFGIPY